MPQPTQLQGITDLTLIARIKPGLIDGIFDSRSYAWRLQRVLELLDAARRGTRESDALPNPFIDSVGRLRGIHFFRFAVLPRENRLLLNVTFDGGWEPYMRLIWGPLGPLLDLIFCHCEGYPLAAASSFDHYIRWVRDHEVPSQFFYADSGASVADRAYAQALEQQQRADGARPDADLRAAQLALEPPQRPEPTAPAVMTALRSLKGLYGLTTVFGLPPEPQPAAVPLDDGSVLLRFAQDYLGDLRGWYAQGLLDPGQRFDHLRAPFERERLWLMRPRWTPPAKRDPRPLAPTELQAGIVRPLQAPTGRFTRGALVMVRVNDAATARHWLQSAATSSTGTPARIADGDVTTLADDQVTCTVAITYPGLQALGMHADHLAALPAEFIQGMESRAGILGDVRGNHPLQWQRPPAWQAASPMAPIDLSMVHLLIQLRTVESQTEAAEAGNRSALLPRLADWMAKALPRALQVLAVEPCWSRPCHGGEPAARNHFGYVDGISQPGLQPTPNSLFWDDAVKAGELLLGWTNERGDGPLQVPDGRPAPPAWMEASTFLVLRKIRQHVERFDAIVNRAAADLQAAGAAGTEAQARELVRAKLMGRSSDGSPLVSPRGDGFNDFDYRNDGDAAQCPFASHVRRSNPRGATNIGRPPRIMRRGMSYGDADGGNGERGVLFMAYNASIAEQFEVIQRWVAGGNSSGVSSSQPDPFLGVPQAGRSTIFRCVVGNKVLRIDLGDQPICSLAWGLYAFVPSLKLLQELDGLTAPAPQADRPAMTLPPSPGPSPVQRVKLEFEDETGRRARWEQVRKEHSGVERIGGSVMVGSVSAIMQVLQDPGSTYSAAGYGRRMGETLGASPFGEDDVGPQAGHKQPVVEAVKQAIDQALTEAQAYEQAYRIVATRLATQLGEAKGLGLGAATVDFVELGVALLASLCEQWFGVEFGTGLAEPGSIDAKPWPVRCPGHFLSVARYIFSAYPNTVVTQLANAAGPTLKEAMDRWTQGAASNNAPVLYAVLAAIDKTAKGLAPDIRQGIAANVMLGMPATLLGSWGKVMRILTVRGELWRLQHALLTSTAGARPNHGQAVAVLRQALIATMAVDPVADGIWREVRQPHMFRGTEVEAGDIVCLGIGAALAEDPGDLQRAEDLLFGGAWGSGSGRATVHACPGRRLATGALLGALAAWLGAGQWAITASPTALTLKPLA